MPAAPSRARASTSLCALRWLASVVALAAFLLILVGGFVTASESGLGCGPEWPVCVHAFLPPAGDFHAWVEWAHRLLAGVVSVGVVAVAILAHRAGVGRLRALANLALACIALEILLGMATVLLSLPAAVVAVHMLDAVVILDALVAIAYLVWRPGTGNGAMLAPAPGLFWAAALAALTAAIGSYVSHSGAGLACAQGPACLLSLTGAGGGAVAVFGLHALSALTLAAVAVAAFGDARRVPGLYAVAVGGLGLQAGLGIALVAGRLAPALLVVHEGLGVATAALFWLAAWAAASRPVGPSPRASAASTAASVGLSSRVPTRSAGPASA
jgi:heme A synthase